ncbi:MAG: ABC transporter substrate-binding protein [Frankiaceae bacterium]|nr:ABC transporter substrate-binding protein [Frankiaceae bacterium]
MNRPRPATESALGTLALIVGVGIVLSVLTVVPSGTTQLVAGGNGGGGGNNPVAQNNNNGNPVGVPTTNTPGHKNGGGNGNNPTTTPNGGGAIPPPKAGLSCDAQHNGGPTDRGVSATTILMAATTVTDGPGATFLGPMNGAITAVEAKVKRAGGICGRNLKIKLNNDSWQQTLGEKYIQDFVQGDRVFGLAVNPDSEGLYAVAKSGYLDQQQVPVVGSGGQTGLEYTDPWIWPVGTATISQMHIMAKDAYDRGARNFGIVFDAKYRFGIEGAYAYEKAVERLTGKKIPGYNGSTDSCAQNSRFCGVQPGQSSYSSTANQFNNACYSYKPAGFGNCDFITYLMEPDLALSWLSNGSSTTPAYGQAGAQPLFDRQAFANQCQECNAQTGFVVWTGYQPPEGSYSGQAAEAKYVSDLKSSDSSTDVDNQFVEGAYIGMNLLVNALQAIGPDLTRQRLKAVLDATTFQSGLTKPLAWVPGHHFANNAAMGWRLNYSNGSFSGFSAVTSFEPDPWLGQDLRSGG